MATNTQPSATGSTTPGEEIAELTDFQKRILAILAQEARYGLGVLDELEDYYGRDITHGRLYPNLDDLVQKGFVEKSELDKRTNDYSLTDAGRGALREDLLWYDDRIDIGGPAVDTEGDA